MPVWLPTACLGLSTVSYVTSSSGIGLYVPYYILNISYAVSMKIWHHHHRHFVQICHKRYWYCRPLGNSPWLHSHPEGLPPRCMPLSVTCHRCRSGMGDVAQGCRRLLGHTALDQQEWDPEAQGSFGICVSSYSSLSTALQP